jgi:predicted DNA-binding transcriptional regulator AlpA
MQEAHVIGPDWISQHQLAKQLKRSLVTLQRWRKQRKSPPFAKLGGDVYYRRQDIDEWMKARLSTTPVRSHRIEIVPPQRNARRRNARRAAK